MSYYDHATHLALRLDGWDMSGENGTGDARLAETASQVVSSLFVGARVFKEAI